MTRQGTGEERGGRSPGDVTRGRSTEDKTLTDRGRQTATRKIHRRTYRTHDTRDINPES